MTAKPNQPTKIQIYQVIWGALLGSQFMYAFVNFSVVKSNEGEPLRWIPSFNVPIELALSLAAVASVFASFIIPRFLARSAGKPEIPVNIEPEDYYEARLGKLFPAYIVQLAVTESVCIFGLALSFTTHNPGVFAPFFTAGVILFLRILPSNPKKIEADLGVPSRSTY
jgi:hypothetical protein